MTLKLSAEITHNSDTPILSYGVSFTAMDLTSLCKAVYNRVMTQKGNQMITTEIHTARKIDTQLAELQGELNKHLNRISNAYNSLNRYGFDLERARIAGQTKSTFRIKVETIESETVKADAIKAQMRDLNEAHYTGWNRFFLVQHLHNNQYCSSFRWNTKIAWCPEISGLTEEEAVAEFGETLCTICFKSAPTQ